MATLSYVSLFARDLDRVADFYRDLFALEEIAASRSEKYREFLTGGSKLGIVYWGGYALLDLPAPAEPGPVSQIITFDVGERAAVAPTTEKALAAGATLIKSPYDTHFGQHLSVLLDPEGSAFRISAAA